MYNEVRTTKERMEFVLTHNFDDIKRSKYMDEIRSNWVNTYFDCFTDKKKQDNAFIAFDQIVSFMATDATTYNNVSKDKLYTLINTKLGGVLKFENVILDIVYLIYRNMYYSDYTYIEILKHYCEVDLTPKEVKNLFKMNFEQLQKEFVNLMARKIMYKMVYFKV